MFHGNSPNSMKNIIGMEFQNQLRKIKAECRKIQKHAFANKRIEFLMRKRGVI